MRKLLPILLLLALFGTKSAQATHIMGGDLTYKHLHDSTYELKFLVYRDCNNGQANIDANITYWVYYKRSKQVYNYGKRISLSSKGVFDVDPEAPNCVVPTGVCIEAGEYIDTVTLGGDPDGYIVTWYRMERNHAIDNLSRCVQDPDNTSCNPSRFRPCSSTRNRPFGLVWTAEIPSYKYKNSSPQFLTAPVPYFCKGITNIFNHVAFDPDGDSLYFENVTPLSPEECSDAAPTPSSPSNPPLPYADVYQNVTYQSGYSVTKPFGSTSSSISVNANTGEIIANPRNSGQYVIAIKISEYRVDPVTHKAVYLGSIRRDLQFISGTCPSNTPPKLTSGNKTNYYIDPDSTLKFTFSGTDSQDTLYLKAVGNILGGDGSTAPAPYAVFRDTTGYKSVSQEFSWTPTCDHITYTTPHLVSIFMSDEGCNTLQRTFAIYVNSKPILGPPPLTCVNTLTNGNIQLTWAAATNLQDAFKSYNIYRMNPNGTRQLVVTFTDSTKTTYVDTAVQDGNSQKYRYYLKTENACNLPGKPSDSLQNVLLSAKEISDKEVELSWSKFRPVGTSTYFVQKRISNAFVNIDTTTSTSINITGCDLSGDYRIFSSVTSSMSSCTSASNIVNVTTKDKTGPSAPVLTQTTYESLSQIRLQVTKSNSPDIDKYTFIRATNGGSFATIATITSSASALTYIDNISNDGTNSYCYRVTGIDECGNKGDTSTLHCPVNLSARTGQLEAILEWKPYVGYDLDSVTVQRYDSVNNKWNRIGSVGATDTFFKDSTDIICNFLYTYRIASHQKNGSLVSMSDSAGVRPVDTIKPPRIELITTGILSQSSAGVVFLRSPDADVNKHMVVSNGYYNGKLVSTDSAYTFDKSPDTIQTIVPVNRTDSISYRFQVFAIDSCNENISANSETHHAIQVTGKPLNLAAELNWSHYIGWAAVSAYAVQVFDGTDWKTITNLQPNITTYTHTGLPCNLEQRYRIIGVGNPLISEATISDEIRLTPYDSLPPKAPIVNYVTVVNETTIEINWNQSTSGDAQNYLVFTSKNGGAPIFLDTIARTANPTHTYIYTGINAKANKYCFEILAYDTCNLNISTDHVTHCAMQLEAIAGNKEVKLDWSPYEGLTVSEYEVQQLVNNQWVKVATVSSSVNEYLHTNLQCYQPYTYRIKMTETGSPADSSISDTIWVTPFDTIAPEAPVIRSVSVLNNDSVIINWDHSIANDVYKYVLFQKHPDSTQYNALDTLGYVNENTVSVDASKIDLGYGFAIKAIDECRDNEGVLSNPTSTIVLDVKPQDCENVLELNWQNNPNFKEGLNQYEIYRSENNGAYVLIAISNGNNYLDSVIPYFTYQYYIKATENNGTGFNAISNIKEGIPYRPFAPVVKSVSVTNSGINDGEIEVKWHINPKADYLERQKIYHRESGSANFNVLNANLPITDSSFTHSNLNTKSTNHEYFVVTEDSCGNISDTVSIHKSIDFEFTIGQLTHELKWTKYEGATVANYYVEQLQGSNFVVTDTVSPSLDSLFKFPAPCNTLITYRIAAESNLGHISYSDTASGLAIDNELPDNPILKNVSVTSSAINTINFIGVDSPDVFAYQIVRSANGGNYVHRGYLFYTGVKKAEQFIDSVHNAKGPFSYAVIALDSCLNGSSTDTFKTSQLNGIADHFKNTLYWNKFEGYALNSVELQMFDGTVWNKLQTLNVADTQYIHNDAGCGAPIIYRLMGISANSDTTYSNQLSLTPIDTTPPLTPAIKFATVDAKNRIKLSWENPIDNDVKTYNIYRSDNGGPFTLLNDTTYTDVYYDNFVKSQTNYYNYYIEAIDSCVAQPSPITDTIGTFYFSIEKDTCQTENRYQIQPIEHLGNGVDYYILFFKSANDAIWKGIDTVFAETTTYLDTARVRNANYCFAAQAYDDNSGYVSNSDTICFKQSIFNEPQSPELLLSTIAKSDQVKGATLLQWSQLSVKEEPKLIGYQVMHSDSSHGTYKIVGNLSNRHDTFFYDTTNTSEGYHFYRIVPINGCNVSGDSSLVHSPLQLNVGGLNFAAELSWNPYLGFDVEEYIIERSVNGTAFKTIGTNPVGKYEFVDNLVSCGDSIAYRVSAINAHNKAIIAYSDIESTLGTDTIPPATNNLVNITTANNGKDFVVSWNASNEPDIESYTVIGKPKNATRWTTYGTGLKGTSVTIPNISPTEGEVYEFKVTPQDSCGNIQHNYSTAHNSLGLVASGNEGYVDLEWTNYRGWRPSEFKIYRNGLLINTFNAGLGNADSIYTFKDTISACDTATFSYYIEAINSVGLTSISNVDTALAIDQSAPARVYLKNATTLEDGTIELQWREYKGVEEIEYRIEYSADGGDWTVLTELAKANNLYNFSNPVPGKRLCLRISTFDDCGNVSKPSNLACVILLEGGNLAQANSLKWTKYETWIDSVGQYTIYRTLDSLTWYPIVKVENRVKSYVDTILVDDIYTYCYKVEATSLNSDKPTKSSSNVLCIKQEPILYIPNSFSPGASAGLNDEFGPIGSFLPKDYTMKIYSRWGQRIYETTSGVEWNGTMPDGSIVPDGLYLYVISFTDSEGQIQLYEGAVRVFN